MEGSNKMKNETLTPSKSVFNSKLNWLFVIMGAISASPELTELLNSVTNNMAMPILSAVGVIIRTFFTNTVIRK